VLPGSAARNGCRSRGCGHWGQNPVAWDELEAVRAPDDLVFSPADALERLERDGDLFAPVLSEVQALPG
jgi:DNA primase